MNELTVDNLRRDLLTGYELEHSLLLAFQRIKIEVRSNSRDLIDDLSEYFREFISKPGEPDIIVHAIEGDVPDLDTEFTIKQPDPGKTRIKEEFVDLSDGRIVRKVLTGMMFIFGGDTHIGVGPCISNSNQIVNFINNRYIEHMLKENCLLFHSSGIVHNNRGILFSGFSGAGKSTLALHVLRKGLTFLSNDRAMVRREDGGLMMYGVPKLPRVNPGTLLSNEALKDIVPEDDRKRFMELPEDELWELEHKYDVYIDEVYGKKKFKLGSGMESLVILNWKRGSKDFRIQKVDLRKRRDLLPAFMKSPGLFFLVNRPEDNYDFSEEAYIRLLDGHPVYEISGGLHFDRAVDAVMKLLNREKVN
jgi:HprK-related kinase B